ncbi:MAG: YbaB/EbfC family nucleoid-associated protein [Victivallaceae bacterium]|nr:YbaB/EbfC family nucleoid-associated protein [Victivallaceae bacterium]
MFGNLGQMASLLGRVKDIQAGIAALKKELPGMEFSSECGGVTAVVGGDFQLKRLEVAPGVDAGAIAGNAREAVNGALASAKGTLAARMKEISGGIDLPGIL